MILTNSREEDEIDVKHLAEVVNNCNGIFKNSKGKKILLINGVENKKEVELARLLLEYIDRNIELVISGSLKEKNFKVLKK
jgi:probable selenium-dependent hydroxylase accessory protein YqeC